MLLLLLILPLIVTIRDTISFIKSDPEDKQYLFSDVGIVLIVGICVPLFIGMATVQNIPVLREKIETYEEENLNIESNINAFLNDYLENNEELASDINSNDYTTEELAAIIISHLYPEVDFDMSVQSEIELYRSNSEKIKELKSKLVKNYSWYWWVYFKSPSEMMKKDKVSDIYGT